jgi:hypothetical protein
MDTPDVDGSQAVVAPRKARHLAYPSGLKAVRNEPDLMELSDGLWHCGLPRLETGCSFMPFWVAEAQFNDFRCHRVIPRRMKAESGLMAVRTNQSSTERSNLCEGWTKVGRENTQTSRPSQQLRKRGQLPPDELLLFHGCSAGKTREFYCQRPISIGRTIAFSEHTRRPPDKVLIHPRQPSARCPVIRLRSGIDVMGL